MPAARQTLCPEDLPMFGHLKITSVIRYANTHTFPLAPSPPRAAHLLHYFCKDGGKVLSEFETTKAPP